MLVKLNLAYNKIKSLKGIENNKMLEMLLLCDNQIREKNEVDVLSVKILCRAMSIFIDVAEAFYPGHKWKSSNGNRRFPEEDSLAKREFDVR